jgi:hypothetical protein
MDQSHDSMLARYFKDFLPTREYTFKNNKAISKKWLSRKDFFLNLKSINAPDKIIDIFSASLVKTINGKTTTLTQITTYAVHEAIKKHYDIIKKYEQEYYTSDFLHTIMSPLVGKELKTQKELYNSSGFKIKIITITFIKKIISLYDVNDGITSYLDTRSVLFLLENHAQMFNGKTLKDLESDHLDFSWFTDEMFTTWLEVSLTLDSFRELLENMSMYNKALLHEACSNWKTTPTPTITAQPKTTAQPTLLEATAVDTAINNLITTLNEKNIGDVSVESKVKDVIALAIENNIQLSDVISEKISCYLNNARKVDHDILHTILAKADGSIYPDLIDGYKAGENPIRVANKIINRAERDKILDMELSTGEFKHSIEKTLASILQVYIVPYLTKSSLTVSDLLTILKAESLENPAYYSIKPRDVKQDMMKSIKLQNQKIDKELGCAKIDMSKLDQLKEKFKRVTPLNKNPKKVSDFNYVRASVRHFLGIILPSALPKDLYTDILKVTELRDNIQKRFIVNAVHLVSFDEYINDLITYDTTRPLITQEDLTNKASKIVAQWNAKLKEEVDIKKISQKLQPTYYYQKLEQDLYEASFQNGVLDKSIYYDKCSYPIFLILGNTFIWFKSLTEREKYQILLHTIQNKSFLAVDKNDPEVEVSYIPEYTTSSVQAARLIFRTKYLTLLLEGHIVVNKNMYHIYATLIPSPIIITEQRVDADVISTDISNYNVKVSHLVNDKKLILLMNGDFYMDTTLIRQGVDELYVALKDGILVLYLNTGRYIFSYLNDIPLLLPLSVAINEVEFINDMIMFHVDDQKHNFDSITQLKKTRISTEPPSTVTAILTSQDPDLKIIKDLLHIKRKFVPKELKEINVKIDSITSMTTSEYYMKLVDILMPFFEFSETRHYLHTPIEIGDYKIIKTIASDVPDYVDEILYEIFSVMNPISSQTFILDSFVKNVRIMLLLVRLDAIDKVDKRPAHVLDSKYDSLTSFLEKLKLVAVGNTELTGYYNEPKHYHHLKLEEYIAILNMLDTFPDKFKVHFITFFKNMNPAWFNSKEMKVVMDLTVEIKELEQKDPTSVELAMKYTDRSQVMENMNKSSTKMNSTMKWDTSDEVFIVGGKKGSFLPPIKTRHKNTASEQALSEPVAIKSEPFAVKKEKNTSKSFIGMREKVQHYIELLSSILALEDVELPDKKILFISIVQEYIYKTTSADTLFKWDGKTYKIIKYHFKQSSPIKHLYAQLDRVIMEKTKLSMEKLYHVNHGKPPSMAAYKYTLNDFIEYLTKVNLSAKASRTVESIYFTATRELLNNGKSNTETFKNKQYADMMIKIMDLYLSLGGSEFIDYMQPLKMDRDEHIVQMTFTPEIVAPIKNKHVPTLLGMINLALIKGSVSEREIDDMVMLKNKLLKISEKDYIVTSELIDKFLSAQYSRSDYYNTLLRFVMKLRHKIALY